MKIIAICGSPREKNTAYMLKFLLDLSKQNYELIQLKDLNIKPCLACRHCQKVPGQCIQSDDMQNIYSKLVNADFILLGSPTYFNNVTGTMKNFMDRCLPLYLSNQLKNKKAILLTVGNYKAGETLRGNNTVEEIEEINSVKGCLKTLADFCKHLGISVIDSVYALHSEPKLVESKLIELSKKIV